MSSTLRYKVLLLLLLSVSAFAESPFITCWDNMDRKTGYRAHSWKSAAVSNQGGANAFVELKALPTPHGDCTNTSRLYVRQSNDLPYKLVFTTRVEPDTQGNSLEIVGWSGNQLLLNESSWTYHGDAFYSQPVVYDAKTGTVSRPKIGDLISAQIHKDCSIKAVAKRWVSSEIELTAQDYEIDYGTDEADGCLTGQPKTWLFNPASSELRPNK